MITATLQINAPDSASLEEAMAESLRGTGWVVSKPRSLGETPASFCERIGIHPGSLRRLLSLPECPPVQIKAGPSGRALRLWPDAAFDAFIIRRKQRR